MTFGVEMQTLVCYNTMALRIARYGSKWIIGEESMPMRSPYKPLKSLILLFTAALLLLSCGASAGAEAPADALEKGSTPAASLELETYEPFEGAIYEPTRISVETVRIGLRYGENATDYAEFGCSDETGFALGYFDEDRVFHTEGKTELSWLAVSREEEKIVLTGWGFSRTYDGKRGLAFQALGGGPLAFQGNRYRGAIEVTCGADGGLTVVNVVGLEDYVKGVVPYEMSDGWPYEALRAQAVCARTYVVYNQNKYEEYGFDLTDDTESQVYRGIDLASAETDRAVDSTRGLYVRYRGEICEIYYSAADGGHTEDGINVFGSERPYLAGKTDPFEDAVNYTGRNWAAYRDGEELGYRLSARGFEIGTIVDLQAKYSELGNVIAMTYTDENGQQLTLTEREAYTAIGLNNCHFTVQKEKDVFVFSGSGWGHNCGMSQWGAYAMAELYGYNFEDIIRFYYTGAYVG